MGMSDGVKVILQNADAIGVVAIVLIVVFAFVFALVTSRLYLGTEVKRILKRQDILEETVLKQTTELTDWRVLSAESRVRIEVLEVQLRDKDDQNDRLERRLADVESTLERIRQTWTPPSIRPFAGQETDR